MRKLIYIFLLLPFAGVAQTKQHIGLYQYDSLYASLQGVTDTAIYKPVVMYNNKFKRLTYWPVGSGGTSTNYWTESGTTATYTKIGHTGVRSVAQSEGGQARAGYFEALSSNGVQTRMQSNTTAALFGTFTNHPIEIYQNGIKRLGINGAVGNGTSTLMLTIDASYNLGAQAIPSGGTTYTFSSEFTNSSNTISVNTIAQSKVTNLTTDLAAKAPLASPALTGTPTAPTAAAGTSTTQIATTAFVTNGLAEKQGTLTLTTTGTSGAATLVGNTLNIPNYATGSGGEANTASNLGSGTGIFALKVDADLQFKSLVPGTNTTITSDANTVTIAIPGDLTTFTPRFSGGSGQGDANIAIPVGQLFVYLNEISVASNLTVGFSTSSTSGSQTLHHVIANTNTNATYNWQYSATVKKADGTTVTEIPKGKTHTLFYIPTGAYWLLASEY